MKRFMSFGAVVTVMLAAFAVNPASAQQGTKLAYINSQKILAVAPGMTEAQQTLQAEMQKYQNELKTMETQLDSMQTAMEKQQSTLSATAKQQRQTELQQKFAAYQQRRSELEQTAQQREQDLVAPIMKKISDIIEQLRKEGGYAMIFDAPRAGLATADTTLDLSDQVIARMKAAPAAAAKPAGK
jgi:outer membrane protein